MPNPMDRVRYVITRKNHHCLGCNKLILPGTRCLSRITHNYIAEHAEMFKLFSWYCSQDCYDEVEMRVLLIKEEEENYDL